MNETVSSNALGILCLASIDMHAVQQLQYLIDWLKVVQHFHLLMAICEIVALF